jgi:hypothetical protein
MDEDWQREVADGRESVSLFNQGVHLVPSCQPAAHTSPGFADALPRFDPDRVHPDWRV